MPARPQPVALVVLLLVLLVLLVLIVLVLLVLLALPVPLVLLALLVLQYFYRGLCPPDPELFGWRPTGIISSTTTTTTTTTTSTTTTTTTSTIGCVKRRIFHCYNYFWRFVHLFKRCVIIVFDDFRFLLKHVFQRLFEMFTTFLRIFNMFEGALCVEFVFCTCVLHQRVCILVVVLLASGVEFVFC
jgi:hypothetical protein